MSKNNYMLFCGIWQTNPKTYMETKDREELKSWRTKNWGDIPYKRTTILIKAQTLGQANTMQALTAVHGTESRCPIQTVNMWNKNTKQSQSSLKSRVWKRTTTCTQVSITEHKEAREVYEETFNRDSEVRGQSEKQGVTEWLTRSMR